jgi:hypothetical protein
MTHAERIEIISAAVHASWHAFTVTANNEPGEIWEKSPEWQKDSTRHTVAFLEAFDPAQHDVGYLCEAVHVVWMNDKTRAGWVFGPKKDNVAKTHPCIVPYRELPYTDRQKDEVVIRTYLTMRSILGPPPEVPTK